MKTGFLMCLLLIAIALFITICQQHNSPIIIQPLATKNYFLYRVYIRLQALATKMLLAILVVRRTIFYKENEYRLALK